MIDEVIKEEEDNLAARESEVRSNQNEQGDSSSCSYTFGAHDDDHIDIAPKHRVTPMPGEHEDIPSENEDIHSAAYA